MWKKDLKLPENYHEDIIKYELLLKKEINKETIITILSLYSKGMNYYNLIGNSEFEEYYREKSNNLLFNPKILEILEGKTYIEKEEKINNKENFTLSKFHKQREIDLEINKTIKDIINIKLKEFYIGFEKVDKAITDSIIDQKTIFELNKRQKIVIKKKEEIEKKKNEKINNKDNNESSHFRNKSFLRGNIVNSQNIMLNEIEKYVENNMNEMYKSLEEIQKSYEKEIKEAQETNQLKKIKLLKRDLQGEIESLTLQFEEQREKGIENIMQKYSKKE